MSRFHCSCGFAIDHAEELADHLHHAFARDDDIGTDGHVHAELDGARPGTHTHTCACGFTATDRAELDDHLLIAFITDDGTGTDGEHHVPADPSTPDRWYVRRSADD
jgi:hypothetical protein